MARLTWLADVLRDAGLKVIEDPGWQTRGEDRITVRGVVCHHTASGPTWLDGHVAALLRLGRSDLTGPLSQLGLARDGTWWVIAAGRSNHNGYGLWGNDSIGVEAFNDGIGEQWPEKQLDVYTVGVAAICRHLQLDPTFQVLGHRETDPRRKIDPAGIDMGWFRGRVAGLLAATDPHPPEELTMAQIDDILAALEVLRADVATIKGATKPNGQNLAGMVKEVHGLFATGSYSNPLSPKSWTKRLLESTDPEPVE